MVIHEMRWRMDSWHLCWLSMWILWRYLPLREMGINVEMQTLSLFPIRGDAAVQPCFDWLAAPAAQRTAAFTIFHRAVAVLVREVRSRILLQSVPLHARRWRLVPELIRYMQDKV